MRIAGPLRVPQRLQTVDQFDHVAAVDARGRAQLLLGEPAAGVEDQQDQVLLGPDAPARQHVLESRAHGGAHPGQQESRVVVVRCSVLCGAITVKRPDWLMRRREERLAAKERSQSRRASAARSGRSRSLRASRTR